MKFLTILKPLKTYLSDEVQPLLVAISSIIQLGVPLLLHLQSLPAIFWSAPLPIIGGLYAFSLIAVLYPFQRRSSILGADGNHLLAPRLSGRSRVGLAVTTTIIAIGAFTWTYYEIHRTTDPNDNPPIPPPVISFKMSLPNFENWNFLAPRPAAAATQKIPKASIAFVTERSSLVADNPKDGEIEVRPNPRIEERLRLGKDNETPAEQQELKAITAWLEKQAKQVAPQSIPLLTGKRRSLTDLSRKRPDLVRALLPSAQTYEKLPAEERELVLKWVARYVGQWNPRFQVTIDNTQSGTAITINAIRFDVKEYWRAKGLKDEPSLGALDTFYFSLRLKEGVQQLFLASQKRTQFIEAGKIGAFELVLSPDPQGAEPANPTYFSGILSLETSVGEVSLGRLKLYSYNPWVGGLLVLRKSQ